MSSGPLSRRELLGNLVALGLLSGPSYLSASSLVEMFAEAENNALKPTPPNDLGPFYKANAPKIRNLRRANDPGLELAVKGEVLNTRGEPLPGALVEVWQTDARGQYDNAGFNYRAQMSAEDAGKYAFDTCMPGHYPDRVAQHIHFKISAPHHKTLVTQLYFATDPAFGGDPDKNYRKDPLLESRELVRPVTLYTEGGSIRTAVDFQIVLIQA
jgi:protocatechuate 3,4-dioxygenase beta subunit